MPELTTNRLHITAILAAGILCTFVQNACAAGSGAADDVEVDSAPCLAAAAADQVDSLAEICAPLIDSEKAVKADRVKALIARAGAYARKDMVDRAIADYDAVLRLDPLLADTFNNRGELWRKKGDRPKALSDFAAAIKLNPDHLTARANYKSLAQELERLGALMAVNKPSFNCATASRAVEKAICANPELAVLDREISAANTKAVNAARRSNPNGSRALQRDQDEFIARRNAGFGGPGYDLRKAMQERLDHLRAVNRQ